MSSKQAKRRAAPRSREGSGRRSAVADGFGPAMSAGPVSGRRPPDPDFTKSDEFGSGCVGAGPGGRLKINGSTSAVRTEKKMARTVLVTGGTRGIGLAITRRLAQSGHRLAISYRTDESAASALARELSLQGVAHELFKADLSNPAHARTLPDRVFEKFGGLDGLVNNAGITDDAAFLTMEGERYSNVLRTNLCGAIRLTGAALPYLLKAVKPAIVMVASLGGVVGKEGQVAYAASKGALIGLTQWLGRKYSCAGVTVNAVAPGFIQTDMISALEPKMVDHIIKGTALQRIGQAAEVAEAVNFLLTSGYIQSTTLRVDGGFNR